MISQSLLEKRGILYFLKGWRMGEKNITSCRLGANGRNFLVLRAAKTILDLNMLGMQSQNPTPQCWKKPGKPLLDVSGLSASKKPYWGRMILLRR
jgi:hypothetical protein